VYTKEQRHLYYLKNKKNIDKQSMNRYMLVKERQSFLLSHPKELEDVRISIMNEL
jgi:hypothetical protein